MLSRRILSSIITCFVMGGCGQGPEAPTHADPDAVALRVWTHLREARLDDLHGDLTPAAQEAFSNDVDALRASLARPSSEAPALARLMAERFARDAAGVRARAAQATDAELLRLFLRLRPLPADGAPVLDTEGKRWRRYLYRDGAGVARPLRLEQGPDGWRVASLQL